MARSRRKTSSTLTLALLASLVVIILFVPVATFSSRPASGNAPAAGLEVPAWLFVVIVGGLISAVVYQAFLLEKRRLGLVEDIFLVHRDGRMIRHYSRRVKPVDAEIFSSMLSAVQAFVKDSMRETKAKLEEMRLGDSTILIEHGNHVFLAVVYLGRRPTRLRAAMKRCITRVEEEGSDLLTAWDGSAERVSHVVTPQLARLAGRTY